MTIEYIGQTFPKAWLWTPYEVSVIESVKRFAQKNYGGQRNLVINTTWFGPTFDNGNWNRALELAGQVDNMFIIATVDPMYIAPPVFDEFYEAMGKPKLFKVGNYDDTPYEVNIFAAALDDLFVKYDDDNLILTDIRYKFINYNRKPRFHRVELVKKIIDLGLDKYGIQTLGKPDRTYDLDPNNDLYLTVGEDIEEYRKYGHWFTGEDPTGIPHDVLSLHNMEYWKHHFLHIVGATMFWPWDDVFVSETMFKPIIGLRPFVINGNTRTYQWLRDRGFKTFNQYFPSDLDNTHEDSVHDNIIKTLEWLVVQDNNDLLDMYNDMLPDLVYNKQRFAEFAAEQKKKIDTIL